MTEPMGVVCEPRDFAEARRYIRSFGLTADNFFNEGPYSLVVSFPVAEAMVWELGAKRKEEKPAGIDWDAPSIFEGIRCRR